MLNYITLCQYKSLFKAFKPFFGRLNHISYWLRLPYAPTTLSNCCQTGVWQRGKVVGAFFVSNLGMSVMERNSRFLSEDQLGGENMNI